jgi:hypothetical protein
MYEFALGSVRDFLGCASNHPLPMDWFDPNDAKARVVNTPKSLENASVVSSSSCVFEHPP